ncbi:unnamed protein product [Ambrosiozyma monospora]|uniref:Unnamed protein product n=1 Tax=Ambrosiozyma monospora TaxID=43982 RepID=A0ACB5U0Z6_AMBMO|nr:unnamed protein product [Ambrosiozyma monospora]
MLIGNAAVGNGYWYETYENDSMGGLLNTVFGEWHGFGKFLLIILWLSLITNNTINTYSSALSVQLIDRWFFKHFPRWLIVVVIFVITLICSMVGRNKFSTILSNFLPMLGYWISIYFTLILEENVIFRSTSLVRLFRVELYEPADNEAANSSEYIYGSSTPTEKKEHRDDETTHTAQTTIDSSIPPPYATTQSIPYYNFNAWDNINQHTHGYAACLAFCFGVAGVVLGMNQVYYVGKLASLIGEYNADLGAFLAIGFTGVTYPLLRYIELKKFGR